MVGKVWVIPSGSKKPTDARVRSDYFSRADVRPFVKWVGGKGQLLPVISNSLPKEIGKTINRYVEPFVGGGAVLFNMVNKYHFEEVYISDINRELIWTYETIRDNVEELVELLTEYEKDHISKDTDGRKEYYYTLREKYNDNKMSQSPDTVLNSALFIYLNKTCFNGLYRVNKKGLFNVPSGVYKKPTICDKNNLYNVSSKLSNVIIKCADYHLSEKYADENTMVYFDPPYRPLNISSSFTSYTELSFNDDDQIALSEYVHKLSNKGAFIALSNSDPKNTNPNDNFFDDLYKDMHVNRISASRMINSKADGRGKINEILVTNYPLTHGECNIDLYSN